MPLLTRCVSYWQASAAEGHLDSSPHLHSQRPLKAACVVNDVTDFTLLRKAAARKHLSSFLDGAKKQLDDDWPAARLVSSRHRYSSGFLDVDRTVTRTVANDVTTRPTLPPQRSRVRPHTAHFTAFGAGDDKSDILQPMATPWVMLYRMLGIAGLVGTTVGAMMLDSSVEKRAEQKLDTDPRPAQQRTFSNMPERRAGERHVEDLPCREVIEQTGIDEDGLRIIGDKVVRYDTFMMLRPLRRLKHTILDEAAVWQAECQVMIWFFVFALLTLESTHLGQGIFTIVFQDILTKDGPTARISDFVKSVTAFTSFFLGLFTSMTLGRVSSFWNDGIMRVFRSTEKLVTMLSCDLPERWMETHDPTQGPREILRETVVSSFGRWSQASIIILFEKYGRNSSNEDCLRKVHSKALITDEELTQLQDIPDNHALALWSWHFKLLHRCQTSKLLTIPMQPLHIVHNEGVFGITNVMENVQQPLPFSYISLIAMFVKFMNLAITISGGILCSRALMHGSEVEAGLQLLFAALVPLVTNSIVILNLNLMNPFRDHFTSMSPDDIVNRLDIGIKAAQQGARKAPHFLDTKWEPKT